jgi:Ca-activated chloride channel family protein
MKFLVIAALLFFSSLLVASSAPQDKEKQKDTKQPPPLNLKLNVTVMDPTLHSVNDLTKERFQIFEDDVPQTVSVFERTAGPASIVLATDTSLSMRRQIEAVVYLAKLVAVSIAPDDSLMLESFISSDKIKREADFGSDRASLLKAIDNLYLEGGQSAVIDAVDVANDAIEKYTKDREHFRKFIVLITDGEDRRSYFTQKQLFEHLRKTGVQVFVLALQQDLQTKSAREKASNFLNSLAQETGGNAYYPEGPADAEKDVKQIMVEMKASYILGYESTNPARDAKFRKVRVEVVNPPEGPKLAAFAREGYTAPEH